jgi:hypothetical protein
MRANHSMQMMTKLLQVLMKNSYYGLLLTKSSTENSTENSTKNTALDSVGVSTEEVCWIPVYIPLWVFSMGY